MRFGIFTTISKTIRKAIERVAMSSGGRQRKANRQTNVRGPYSFNYLADRDIRGDQERRRTGRPLVGPEPRSAINSNE